MDQIGGSRTGRGKPCQQQLEALVQSIRWTYSIFWELSIQQGVLEWADGYYNGDIKTRKTVQPIEMSGEELCLQRTTQLRELYESLATRDSQPQARRPCAALSPEDLSDTEWYYLVCMSYSFVPGVGLPGRAFASGSLVWLGNALEADSKVFSRSLLAKSASIQTVVCFPLGDGVLEIGTTDLVREDPEIIHRALKIFIDNPRAKCSDPMPIAFPDSEEEDEDDTDNKVSGMESLMPPDIIPPSPYLSDADKILIEYPEETAQVTMPCEDHHKNYSNNGGGEECDEQYGTATAILSGCFPDHRTDVPDEDWAEDFCDRHETAITGIAPPHYQQQDGHTHPPNSKSHMNNNMMSLSITRGKCCENPNEGLASVAAGGGAAAAPEDSPYSRALSMVLEKKNLHTCNNVKPSFQGAFSCWKLRHGQIQEQNPPQKLLKKALSCVSSCFNPAENGVLLADHVDKLHEKFVVLHSLVPFPTKNDHVSILGDAIQYLKHLQKRTEELEASNKLLETETHERKRRRIYPAEDLKPPPLKTEKVMQVSVREAEEEADAEGNTGGIEIEVHCAWRQDVLVEIMQNLTALDLHITSVQSSLQADNIFTAHLRAKARKISTEKEDVRHSIAAVKAAVTEAVDRRLH